MGMLQSDLYWSTFRPFGDWITERDQKGHNASPPGLLTGATLHLFTEASICRCVRTATRTAVQRLFMSA